MGMTGIESNATNRAGSTGNEIKRDAPRWNATESDQIGAHAMDCDGMKSDAMRSRQMDGDGIRSTQTRRAPTERPQSAANG